MRKIAILGFGTVGSGVYEVLRTDPNVDIAYILDLREFPGHPLASRVTKDFDAILADRDVEVVVETLGGTGVAYTCTRRALEAGKSVVTSNKAVVDAYGQELEALARENGVSYLYEASVGGGIPIIRPLRDCFRADRILRVSGILNGTTNYILTRMAEAHLSMEDALQEAQQLGYAEQDPTADIEGHDCARKICILAGLAFGKYIPYTSVQTLVGIRDVTAEDIRLADTMGYGIKLLGIAEWCGEQLALTVAPYLVPKTHLLYAIRDAFNAVHVTGACVGDVLFYGQGAGSLPTASAVACDILEALEKKPAPVLRTACEVGFLYDGPCHAKQLTLPNGKTYFTI